ncbi:MAG TPA: ATP-binding protein [Candidatus Saccharimonadales bacterium]|nr:ATP-binding protein [Candidatus Saccharimonadales bacterium]
MKRTLYLMLGYPGSGKSHFSKRFATQIKALRLNSDHLRRHLFDKPEEHHGSTDHLLVFGALAYAAHEALSAGHSVVCDANYNFVKDRARYAAIAHKLGADVAVIWIKTPIDIAVERGENREITNDQMRFAPEHVLRVASEIEAPSMPDEYYVEIDGTLEFEDQFAQFKKQIRSLHQSK